MIKNYFKTAWRNLHRNKLYSFINITGLAMGLAVCMLILLYTAHESSYDTFHKNADRIIWIKGSLKMGNDAVFATMMSYATAPLAAKNAPFIDGFVRYNRAYKNPVIENPQYSSLRFSETAFLFADSNFFSFFSFPLLNGNKQVVLNNPFSVVISEKMAKKYFGNSDPVGKTIRYNNEYTFTVTGVAAGIPSNSSIQFDFVASLSSLAAISDMKQLTESQSVQLGSFSTYFLLQHPQQAPQLEAVLLRLNKTINTDNNERYFSTLLTHTHLDANFTDGSNTKYLKIFPFVAALVLLLALINYISLATARATTRSKEIGVRKVMGAGKTGIATQFFFESALYTAISFTIGYILCTMFQPIFFNFLRLNVDHSFLHAPLMLVSFAMLFVTTVILSGVYPSLLLSAYKPVQILYGKGSRKNGGLGIRKFFTVFQFTISILLIIGGIVIDRQLDFFMHASTGVQRENVIMVPFASSIGKHYTAFKKEAGSLAAVQQAATAHYPMYKGYDIFFVKPKNTKEDASLPLLNVDENFISLLGLQWKLQPADTFSILTDKSVVLNETAVDNLNLGSNPLFEQFAIGNDQYKVAGVLKDFNYQSLQGKIGALAILVTKDTNTDSTSAWGQMGGCAFFKLKKGANMPATIQQLKTIYDKYENAKPFEYSFLDDAFDAMYKAEDRLSKIFSVFTVFTVFIACLGLFGLSTFMTLQRGKEIGIRKVLGASVSQVTVLLSKDFIKLVLLAVIIASPAAWWIMHRWLQSFAYRVNISGWIFIAAGTGAILIALLTVSMQSIKTAIANPVKSLRTE